MGLTDQRITCELHFILGSRKLESNDKNLIFLRVKFGTSFLPYSVGGPPVTDSVYLKIARSIRDIKRSYSSS